MPCSICRQSGHNRATCPQRHLNPGLQHEVIQNGNAETQRANGRRIRRSRTIVIQPVNNSIHRPRTTPRWKWRMSIARIIHLNRFMKVFNQYCIREQEFGEGNILEIYVPWIKIRSHIPIEKIMRLLLHVGFRLSDIQVLRDKIRLCNQLYNELNGDTNQTANGDVRKVINFMNIRDENYLIYWVVGNYLVQDLDEGENDIKYIGLVKRGCKFEVKTLDGHRFYLIPHRLDIEPPYHPQTDKQFFIQPYCEINIHEGTNKVTFIDDKDKLSELNRWKFNALKLDYLLREIIRLGGKSNDSLEPILDLHEEIQLEEVSDFIKDIAGVPSKMTNIT